MCAVYKIDSGAGGLAPLAADILRSGRRMRFQAGGESMRPFIHSGDLLEIQPWHSGLPPVGSIVLAVNGSGRLLAHRVMRHNKLGDQEIILTQGDAWETPDAAIQPEQVLGVITGLTRSGRQINTQRGAWRVLGMLWLSLAPVRGYLIGLRRGLRTFSAGIRQKITSRL